MAMVVVRRPFLAAIVTMVGGFFILLGGLLIAAFGFGLFLAFGLKSGWFYVGAVLGLLTMVLGGLMLAIPSAKTVFGIVTIVFAFLSLPFALGGFLVGFLLAIIGGIMAILWRPIALGVRVGVSPGGPAPPWG
ncbi:MAG TPA: DUF6114 domain-containing protein [Thermoplasmata archaeon]|nr:DUF6114 domain-containing protein [Thermoplasmata archaeon]